MKKGQIEISFNWIFVMFAGAAILLFFILLINQQTDESQEELARTISVRLENVFGSLQGPTDTIQVHDVLTRELVFECDIQGHSYTVERARYTSFIDEVLFSPRTVGSSEIISWALTYKAPFPIQPMLLVSDANTHYVFVDGAAQDIRFKMREHFSTSTIINPSDFADRGHRHYVFITTNSGFSVPSSVSQKSSKVIIGDRVANINNQDVIVPTQELLAAAIISGDAELYNCGLEKLDVPINVAHELVKQRARLLKQQYVGTDCENFYQDSLIKNRIDNMLTHYNNDDMDLFHEEIQRLEDNNQNMRRRGCVALY